MKEAIIRMSSLNEDVEIAIDDGAEPLFKKVKNDEFVRLVNRFFEGTISISKRIKLFDDEIIGMDDNHILVKQKEKKRIVSLNLQGNVKTYKLNYPNSIYVIKHNKINIKSIECYSYKKYEGNETELYAYPMPNELMSNNLCIGNADRTINDRNYIQALERIIFGTPYSHAKFSGINGFSDTVKYFDYLEKNEFPYKLLKPLNKKLKDILEG